MMIALETKLPGYYEISQFYRVVATGLRQWFTLTASTKIQFFEK